MRRIWNRTVVAVRRAGAELGSAPLTRDDDGTPGAGAESLPDRSGTDGVTPGQEFGLARHRGAGASGELGARPGRDQPSAAETMGPPVRISWHAVTLPGMKPQVGKPPPAFVAEQAITVLVDHSVPAVTIDLAHLRHDATISEWPSCVQI